MDDFASPRRYDNVEWQKWDGYLWSERLIDWYFSLDLSRAGSDRSGPVEFLDVSDAELCRICRVPTAQGGLVREALIKTTVTASKGGLWSWASSKAGGPDSWFAYLVVSLIAAVEAEDPSDRSYIDRLGKIDPGAANQLEKLASLWIRLSDWLLENTYQYRTLMLPDPGSQVRVGYSKGLAFPNRRDSIKLARLLAEEGLDADSALSAVLPPIRGKLSSFSEQFQATASTFDAMLDSATHEELFNTRFWSAVRTGFETPIIDETIARSNSVWSLLVSPVDYEQADIDVVARNAIAPAGYALELMTARENAPTDGEDWDCVLTCSDGDPVAAVLDGLGGLGSLSLRVQDGVIPLRQNSDGDREVARRSELHDVDALLVRSDLQADVVRWANASCASFRTAHPDWSVIVGVNGSALLHSPGVLSRITTFEQLPQPRRLTISGGVKLSRDRYFTIPGRSLQIRAPWAVSCSARTDGASEWELLDEVANGWSLDGRTGVVAIRAIDDTGSIVRERSIHSTSTAVRSLPRLPANLDRWIVNAGLGSANMGWARDLATRAITTIEDVDEIVHLGRDIGRFTERTSDAAWELRLFGTKTVARSLSTDLEPVARAESKGDRRVWRKLLNQAEFSAEDEGALYVGRVVGNASHERSLPTFAQHAARPDTGLRKSARQLPAIADLEQAVVAISNAKAGMSYGQFLDLAALTAGGEAQWDLLHDWLDASLIEVGADRGWTTRTVFLIPPRLEIFDTGQWFGASIVGATTSQMRGDAAEIADASGIISHSPGSVSPFVPSRRSFRSDHLASLEQLADRLQIPRHPLAAEPKRPSTVHDIGAIDPPIRYEESRAFEFPLASGVEVMYWKRRDSPSYWTVRSSDRTLWSYHRNVAHFLARRLARQPTHEVLGTDIRAWCPLPVTVSRWLVALGAPSAGNLPDGTRLYPTPSLNLAHRLSSYIDSLADQLAPL